MDKSADDILELLERYGFTDIYADGDEEDITVSGTPEMWAHLLEGVKPPERPSVQLQETKEATE